MYRVVEVGSFSFPMPGKEVNEDCMLLPIVNVNGDIALAIADGVGSRKGASQASMIAIDAVRSSFWEENFSVGNVFENAIKELKKRAIHDDGIEESATTLTAVFFIGNKVFIGHVGDCRVYVKRQGKLFQLTKDHTKYQELLDSREHGLKKLRFHKDRLSRVLTKALSVFSSSDFDIQEYEADDFFEGESLVLVLMSDGAHSYWQKRPKFSPSTMSTPTAFVNSLKKRIEVSPIDDFSCLSVKITR